jgi:formate dehydrogenase subunit delta
MNPANLIKMANQIGAFFEAMPDSQQAIAGVAEHIRKTWEPRMQTALINHVAANGDQALLPIVRSALARIR